MKPWALFSFMPKSKASSQPRPLFFRPPCSYIMCYATIQSIFPPPNKRRLEKFFFRPLRGTRLARARSADPAAMASVRLLGPDLREPLIIQDLDVNQTIEHLKERALGQWPSGAPPAAKLLLVCFVTGWPVHSHAVLFTRRRDGRAIDRAGEDHPPGPLPGGQDAPERCALRAVNSSLRLCRRSSWLRLAGCA
jgi:hypothetical protein